jgi:hypothetical protein
VFATSHKESVSIVREQLQLMLERTPFIQLVSSIICCVSGNDMDNYTEMLRMLKTEFKHPKLILLKTGFGDTSHERYTLRELISAADPKCIYLYLHNKGATKSISDPDWNNIQQWRRMMEYFLIEHSGFCIQSLVDGRYDVAGALWYTWPQPHFSGNFWWASGAYLKRVVAICPTIGPNYLDCEIWLGQVKPNILNMWPIKDIWYHKPEPRSLYAVPLNGTPTAYKIEVHDPPPCLNANPKKQPLKNNCYVFFHVFMTDNPKSLNVLNEQIDTMMTSSLITITKAVFCCISATNLILFNRAAEHLSKCHPKFIILHQRLNDTSYERLTLNCLIGSDIDPDAAYLYLHTKGTTKNNLEWDNVQDWRRLLEFFVVENAEKCIDKLLKEDYEVAGALMSERPSLHFSGNFWWAKGSYLKQLIKKVPIVGSNYFAPELWIGLAHPKAFNFYPLTKSHYQYRTFRYEYEHIFNKTS